MNLKRNVVLEICTFLLLSVTILTGCGGNDMRPEKALKNFSKQIEQGNLNDIHLTVYYLSPFILTRTPLSIDDLVNHNAVQKFVVDGSTLKEHTDLLSQISNDVVIPVEQKSHINTRLYFVFETTKDKKIFDVSMWGDDNSIFINGLEVKENKLFYDVVSPFLPEDAVKELNNYIAGIWPE